MNWLFDLIQLGIIVHDLDNFSVNLFRHIILLQWIEINFKELIILFGDLISNEVNTFRL